MLYGAAALVWQPVCGEELAVGNKPEKRAPAPLRLAADTKFIHRLTARIH